VTDAAPARSNSLLDHPARYVVRSFVAVIAFGTAALMLPFATAEGRSTGLVDAAFTATSAVCVTGLSVVETSIHWTGFGEAVILLLIEVGGLGFMTLSSLLVLLLSKRLGFRRQLIANTERSALSVGDVRSVLRSLAVVTASVQLAVALWLALRFWLEHDTALGTAVWSGVFHSVSAFNNAGFALYRDSMMGFAGDWVLLLPVMGAIFVGGLGFPVLLDLRRVRRNLRALTLHSKVTISASIALLVVGFFMVAVLEWNNPATLGGKPLDEKLLNSAFHSVTPRTAGFNTVDVGSMQPETLLGTIVLMFIGAGSAGTSGGIKVGTFAILALVIWSQLRGETDVTGFRRRIPSAIQRQATTVALLAVGLVIAATALMLVSADLQLSDAAFEAVSAFGTVGLSTGVTAELPSLDRFGLMALMLIGRVGPITLFTALVLRSHPPRYRLPEEGPLIG
jgi:trk system potassium uptake protein